MAGNNRVFWALEEICIGPEGSSSGLPVHGLQSVGLTTSFNIEQVLELGQLEVYELVENLPNVEITLEKCLDGQPLIYHLASRSATSRSLLNRTNGKADVVFSIFSDLQDNASGAPLTQAYCSGMYLNSLNYNLPVQGPAKESVSLVGNDKSWRTSSFLFNGHFNGTDVPNTTIQRRQHVLMGLNTAGGSTWPSIIPGMTVTNGSGYNVQTGTQFAAHIQDVSISANLGRQDIFELGRKRPCYRYASFPVAVQTSISVVTAGTTPGDLVNANGDANNLSNEPIMIKMSDGTTFDMGNKNKCTSVSYGGGSTGGEPATVTYQFENFNKLDVVNAATDPAGIA